MYVKRTKSKSAGRNDHALGNGSEWKVYANEFVPEERVRLPICSAGTNPPRNEYAIYTGVTRKRVLPGKRVSPGHRLLRKRVPPRKRVPLLTVIGDIHSHSQITTNYQPNENPIKLAAETETTVEEV